MAGSADDILDLLILGGGVNGCAVARDAAGRGLSVALLEAGDLAGATSSSSTKLIHGGLRYLEFHAFGLVRKALAEREVILAQAPHLVSPLGFLIPVEAGKRSRLMLRIGLFLYDHLARRHEIPGSGAVDLWKNAAGPAFRRTLRHAYRYYDARVDDARLVVSLAIDAARRGAAIRPHDAAVRATRTDFGWEVETASGRFYAGRQLLNATGPWAEVVARDLLRIADPPRLSLVQGAHLVTRKVNRTADAWLLQQDDGRIVFVIPYEGTFSLIGTTETPLAAPGPAHITADEESYLLAAVNRSLARPLAPADIRWRYAGIRPLVLEEGKDARETTREWKLAPHPGQQAMTVVGGKITTHRLLAEDVLQHLFPKTKRWTRNAPLPGGDVPHVTGGAVADYRHWLAETKARHPNHDPQLIERMGRLYGTETTALLDGDLGEHMGGLFEAELQRMRDIEWATSADDVLWRRTKLGLHLDSKAKARIAAFFGR